MWSDWNCDEPRSLEDMTAICEERIQLLLDRLYAAHPDLEELCPAEIVEDALIFCGFGVVDEPLPGHQMAVCDMGQRLVVINSEMGLFVHKWTNLLVLRIVTLAHELGHVVLHWSEISQMVFRSYLGDGDQFVDSRAEQKENEANLFARIFLIPRAWLWDEPESVQLRLAVEEKRDLAKATVATTVKRLASRYKVNPSLMKSRLADMGWLYPTAKRQTWSQNLNLRKEREFDEWCE